MSNNLELRILLRKIPKVLHGVPFGSTALFLYDLFEEHLKELKPIIPERAIEGIPYAMADVLKLHLYFS